MTRIAEIKTAIRHMLAGTAKVLGAAAVVLLLVLAPGCKKEVTGPVPAVFGGPADVTLILNNSSDRNSSNPIKEPATKAVTIDEINTVHSLKIYAFKHDPYGTQNDELVAYGSYEGITGAGPHYIRMELSASGEIDFYVIANDIYAAASTVLNEKSTRSDIENFRFTGLVSPDDTDAAVAVPMSNIPDGTATDRNNFTYTVRDNSVIPVEVSRAMARLSLFLVNASDEGEAKLTSAKISHGPVEAGMFSANGEPTYTDIPATWTFLNSEHKLLNVSGILTEDKYPMLPDEAYILPNTSGSSDPDRYIAQGNSEESHAYNVVLTFKINETYDKTYTVYIPPVKPNDWIKIYGAVNSHVDVNLTVQIDSWITNEIEIPPFM